MGSDSYFWVIGYDKNKNAITDGLDTYPAGISYFKGPLVSKSFTTTPTTVYLKVCCLGILTKDDDVQIEIGTVATTYEDYKESVQDILFSTPLRSLPSEMCIRDSQLTAVLNQYFDWLGKVKKSKN